MKIELYYNDLLLGEFVQKDKQMFYSSNSVGEKEFCEKYYNSIFYNLKSSANIKINELPDFLKEFEEALSNPKFIRLANLNNRDSLYEKLCKLSQLNFDHFNYHLELK